MIKVIGEERRRTILKLREIYSMGYIPSRNDESYNVALPHISTKAYHLINCCSHACLNLTNKQLSEIEFDYEDRNTFGWFGDCSFDYRTPNDIKDYTFEILEMSGLKVERSFPHAIIKNNQWKVAYFYQYSPLLKMGDFHFLLQEKDGSWSSKEGYTKKVKKIDELPNLYSCYDYVGTFALTNPYAKEMGR